MVRDKAGLRLGFKTTISKLMVNSNVAQLVFNKTINTLGLKCVTADCNQHEIYRFRFSFYKKKAKTTQPNGHQISYQRNNEHLCSPNPTAERKGTEEVNSNRRGQVEDEVLI